MGAQYTLPFTPATYTIEAQSNARSLNYVLGTTDVSEFFKVAYIDYTTGGSTNNLTMPSRASYISVILIGGGGGGGGSAGGTFINNLGGGGGGAGAALVSNAFSVASGSTIVITVGAGGAGGATGANGSSGTGSAITIGTDTDPKFSVNGGGGGKRGVSGGTAGIGGAGGTIQAGALDTDKKNTVDGYNGASGSGSFGGSGGSRTTLNNASPAYCEDYIATGGSGSGAGGVGGTSGSGGDGTNGFVRIYFYI